MKKLILQAIHLLRQNPFYSLVAIVGTAVTIAFVMVVVMIYEFRIDEYQRYEPFIYLPTPRPEPLWWQHMVILLVPYSQAKKRNSSLYGNGLFSTRNLETLLDGKVGCFCSRLLSLP